MKLLSLLLAGAALAAAPSAQAKNADKYPERPITLVVPFTPGAGPDVLSRELGRIVSQKTGQPVVVMNRPGASSTIAAQAVANAKPDGYTLLLTGNVAITGNPHTLKELSYDPIRDLSPVTGISRGPMVLYVSTERVAARSLAEFAAEARQRPVAPQFAYTSITTRLPSELLAQRLGVPLEGVAYKSGASALPDVVAGRLDMLFTDLSAWTYVEQGKLWPLAVSDSRRSTIRPEIPTLAEGGVQGAEVLFWLGLYAPAGTPPAIVQRLSELFGEATASPAATSLHTLMGTEPYPTTPAELASMQAEEIAHWGTAIRDAGIEPQ